MRIDLLLCPVTRVVGNGSLQLKIVDIGEDRKKHQDANWHRVKDVVRAPSLCKVHVQARMHKMNFCLAYHDGR